MWRGESSREKRKNGNKNINEDKKEGSYSYGQIADMTMMITRRGGGRRRRQASSSSTNSSCSACSCHSCCLGGGVLPVHHHKKKWNFCHFIRLVILLVVLLSPLLFVLIRIQYVHSPSSSLSTATSTYSSWHLSWRYRPHNHHGGPVHTDDVVLVTRARMGTPRTLADVTERGMSNKKNAKHHNQNTVDQLTHPALANKTIENNNNNSIINTKNQNISTAAADPAAAATLNNQEWFNAFVQKEILEKYYGTFINCINRNNTVTSTTSASSSYMNDENDDNPLLWYTSSRTRPDDPLCKECLDIMQKACPIDITATRGNNNDNTNSFDPLVATEEQEQGTTTTSSSFLFSSSTIMIQDLIDVHALRRQYYHHDYSLALSSSLSGGGPSVIGPLLLLWNVSRQLFNEACQKENNDSIILSQKVQVMSNHSRSTSSSSSSPVIPSSATTTASVTDTTTAVVHERKKHALSLSSTPKPIKLFCVIYTTDAYHDKIQWIRQTWGYKCDGFLAASNRTDPTVSAFNVTHIGPESYQNMWQKVRSIWTLIYTYYFHEYDWFHIGGDDMYVIVENLRWYLNSNEIRTASNGGIYMPYGNESYQYPLYLGRRVYLNWKQNHIYNSGGPGYTLNKAALKVLVHGLSKFYREDYTSVEDVMVSRILKLFGIYPYETKDKYGGERYIPSMPGYHFHWQEVPFANRKASYEMYSVNVSKGLDHVSAQAVAFHKVKTAEDFIFLHSRLYGLCSIQ